MRWYVEDIPYSRVGVFPLTAQDTSIQSMLANLVGKILGRLMKIPLLKNNKYGRNTAITLNRLRLEGDNRENHSKAVVMRRVSKQPGADLYAVWGFSA